MDSLKRLIPLLLFCVCGFVHARTCSLNWTDSCTHVSPTGSDVSALYDQLKSASLACDVQPTSSGGGGWASCNTFNWTSTPNFNAISGSRNGQVQCQTAQGSNGPLTNFSVSFSCDSAASSSSSSSSSSVGQCQAAQGEVITLAERGSMPRCFSGCEIAYNDNSVVINGQCSGDTCTLSDYKYTGNQCSSGGSSSSSGSSASSGGQQQGNCFIMAGKTICTEAPQKQCGTVNGDEVCASSSTAGCVKYPSGGVACVASTSPPGPDNGTAGQAASPTATVTNVSNNVTTNYYDSSVVNNSSTTVVTNGSGSTASAGSQGESVSASSQSDVASGGDDCTAPPACDGDQIQCAILRQEWNNRCDVTVDQSQAGDVMGQADAPATETVDMSNVLHEDTLAHADGSCPADPTFTVNGHTFTLPFGMFLCQFFAWVAPVVMVVAYFTAARILIGSI